MEDANTKPALEKPLVVSVMYNQIEEE